MQELLEYTYKKTSSMKLTGKCKKAFEKWLKKTPIQGESARYNLPFFYTLSNSMQYGVYVDFFDSVGILVNSYSIAISFYKWGVWDNKEFYDGVSLETRHEARTEAIKQANKIYNEKHSD